MAQKSKVIIDTDPGVDDTLAMLLAFASSSDDIEVAMISVSYGNIPLRGCLKNVLSLFHVLDKELNWRRANNIPEGFDCLKNSKPIVAIGPEHALEEELLAEDGFHGRDGLHGVHDIHPHLTPEDTWSSLFDPAASDQPGVQPYHSYFSPSKTPAHREILRILKEEPEDTVSICVIGPLTNVAMAAAHDTETFLRVKELVVMGGAVDCPGNITPVAEFNTIADAVAAARVFALTSPRPASTMPVVPQPMSSLPPYPKNLSKRLTLRLFPLDVTTPHVLRKDYFMQIITPHVEKGSPLAIWVKTFMEGTYRKIIELGGNTSQNPGLQLHDPMTIWYLLSQNDARWGIGSNGLEDIRIETLGQWTHGMMIRDRRGLIQGNVDETAADVALEADQDIGDALGWTSASRGNRIYRYVRTPGEDTFAIFLMDEIFGFKA